MGENIEEVIRQCLREESIRDGADALTRLTQLDAAVAAGTFTLLVELINRYGPEEIRNRMVGNEQI